MFYSKSTGGFYDSTIHGERTLTIVDPAWTRPTTTITLEPGESYVVDGRCMENTGEAPITLNDMPDMSVSAQTITVPNPNCQIPADSVEIMAEEHAALLVAQSSGKIISAGVDGRPVAVYPPAPSLADQRAAALYRINTACEEAIEKLRVNYPGSEVISWRQQTQEADALDADPNAPTPLLTAIATTRGISTSELAKSVRAKAAAYAIASGKIIGQRQALEDMLEAIDLTADDAAIRLEAIQWPTA